jgi:hypothetical protein
MITFLISLNILQTQILASSKRQKTSKWPEAWKGLKAKSLRNSGEQHIGHRGIEHCSLSVEIFDHHCRYKCNENFSMEM